MAEFTDQFRQNNQEHVRRLRAATMALAQAYAGKWEGDAKRVAPWTNRTGLARGTLNGRMLIFDNTPQRWSIGVRLAHGMEYGVWLELKRTRRGPHDGTWSAVRWTVGDIGNGPANRAEFVDSVRRLVRTEFA